MTHGWETMARGMREEWKSSASTAPAGFQSIHQSPQAVLEKEAAAAPVQSGERGVSAPPSLSGDKHCLLACLPGKQGDPPQCPGGALCAWGSLSGEHEGPQLRGGGRCCHSNQFSCLEDGKITMATDHSTKGDGLDAKEDGAWGQPRSRAGQGGKEGPSPRLTGSLSRSSDFDPGGLPVTPKNTEQLHRERP